MKTKTILCGFAVGALSMYCADPSSKDSPDSGESGAGGASVDAAGASGEATAPDAGSSSPECGEMRKGAGPMAYLPQEKFCIDRTEVTRSQYMAWLATGPSPDGLPERCDSSESFQPSEECMNHKAVCKSGCDDKPMVCVDWCDAYAYCKAMGKRLCGAIGGGPTPFDEFANDKVSQWFAACSSGGQFTYPYGNTFDPHACNVAEEQPSACIERLECDLLNVASLSTCQPPNSPYRGIFDLLGNVMEWEDSYDTATTHCRLRGGSMDPAVGQVTCAFDSMSLTRGVGPHYAGWDVGFRCCLDVTQ